MQGGTWHLQWGIVYPLDCSCAAHNMTCGPVHDRLQGEPTGWMGRTALLVGTGSQSRTQRTSLLKHLQSGMPSKQVCLQGWVLPSAAHLIA